MKRAVVVAMIAALGSMPLMAKTIEAQAKAAPKIEELKNGEGTTRIEYDDDGKRPSRVVSPHDITTYRYSAPDQSTASVVSVAVDGLRLTVERTPGGGISAKGMPTVADLQQFEQGRQLVIQSADGDKLATYSFRTSGQLAEVKLLGGTALEISEPQNAQLTEQIIDRAGKVIATTTTSGTFTDATRKLLLGLDAVAPLLGLGGDWQSKVKVSDNSISSLTTITDLSGHKLAYLVNAGYNGTVGFSAKGEALFYDLDVDVARGGLVGAVDADVFLRTGAAAPNRLVITSSGAVGVYVLQATEHAFQSVWVQNTHSAHPKVGYRTFSLSGGSTKSNVVSPAAHSDAMPGYGTSLKSAVSNRRVQANALSYLYTVCETSDFGRYCTEYYGYTDDSGTGGGSSGGGGTGTASNVKVTRTASAVQAALPVAQQKVASSQCAALLGSLMGGYPETANRMSLSDYLHQKLLQPDWGNYLTNGTVYMDPPQGDVTCSDPDHPAFTRPYIGIVYVATASRIALRGGRHVFSSTKACIP
jgi:hypothetical protein